MTRIVPVFIPHLGCAHHCVFCNQNKITGRLKPPSKAEVAGLLELHLRPGGPDAAVAFYGGSFTGIPREAQEGYLDAARPFIESGLASGVRISTRPDCIDEETLGFLKARHVVTVELGVQSLDDEVLALSGRGHAASDSMRAAGLVKSAGLELGIQLMAGLPGDTEQRFIETVRRTTEIAPSFVRIYPVLVVKGSPLAEIWERGGYSPLALDEAVRLCAAAVKEFRAAGIKAARLGLQPSKELEDALLAGPYHPAFGHLVESEIAFERMMDALRDYREDTARFLVNPAELSVYRGIRSENLKRLAEHRKDVSTSILPDGCVGRGGLNLALS